MDATYGATRWWEYYAVRYLMPSIAGMAIINWICSHSNSGMRTLLSLPPASERLDTASLILLFLYGNLFCYVASYPVLVFHATRALDFVNDIWPGHPSSDGYIATFVLAALAFTVTLTPQGCRYWAAFLLAFAFAAVQLRRLYLVFFPRISVEGCTGTVSRSYGYSYALARRRGKSEKKQQTVTLADCDDNEEVSTTDKMMIWHKDYMDSYRHLREHGNSAFIFLLELSLGALIYCVITKSGESAERTLAVISIIFAIWAAPAVFVHLIGQHLERRFSHFDRRLSGSDSN